PLCRNCVRLSLEAVRQRLQLRRSFARRVRERLRQQPVGKPWISREQRAVEVRADRPADPDALVARLTVVPEPGDDPSERLGTRIQAGATGVVLETRDRTALAGLELALDQNVSDHAP